MVKFRATISGVVEWAEVSSDYKGKSDDEILAIQKEIAAEDPISFCTPDNVHVTVECLGN